MKHLYYLYINKYARILVCTVVISAMMALLIYVNKSQTPTAYFHSFINETGHELSQVSAYYDHLEVASPGRLVVAGKATEGPVFLKIPSEAELRWTENSTPHVAKVNLDGVVPKGITVTICFTLKLDGKVEVKALKEE